MTQPPAAGRRLYWYDLLVPQVIAVAVSGVVAIAAVAFIVMRHGMSVPMLQGLQHDFFLTSIVLDASNIALVIACVWILRRVTDPGLPARFGSLSATVAGASVVVGLLLAGASTAIESLCDRFLHTDMGRASNDLPVLPHGSGHAGALMFFIGVFTVVLLAPLTEEAYFRGILVGWLDRKWGKTVAVATSAIIFGLIHLRFQSPGGVEGWIETAELIGVGAVLALLAMRTRSLWASFLAHATNNLVALLAAVFFSG